MRYKLFCFHFHHCSKFFKFGFLLLKEIYFLHVPQGCCSGVSFYGAILIRSAIGCLVLARPTSSSLMFACTSGPLLTKVSNSTYNICIYKVCSVFFFWVNIYLILSMLVEHLALAIWKLYFPGTHTCVKKFSFPFLKTRIRAGRFRLLGDWT